MTCTNPEEVIEVEIRTSYTGFYSVLRRRTGQKITDRSVTPSFPFKLSLRAAKHQTCSTSLLEEPVLSFSRGFRRFSKQNILTKVT